MIVAHWRWLIDLQCDDLIYIYQAHPKYFRPNAKITYKPLSKPPEVKKQEVEKEEMEKETKKEAEDDGVSNSRYVKYNGIVVIAFMMIWLYSSCGFKELQELK